MGGATEITPGAPHQPRARFAATVEVNDQADDCMLPVGTAQDDAHVASRDVPFRPRGTGRLHRMQFFFPFSTFVCSAGPSEPDGPDAALLQLRVKHITWTKEPDVEEKRLRLTCGDNEQIIALNMEVCTPVREVTNVQRRY